MDKHKPHHELNDIKKCFRTPEQIRTANSSIISMGLLGLNKEDVVEVIQSLTIRNLYKSMTSYLDHQIWQDVYFTNYNEIRLYVKFTIDFEGYLLISFKQR